MNTIKNLNLIEGLLMPNRLESIEAGAEQYKRHTSVIFKIKEVDNEKKTITIVTAQEKTYTDKYFTAKELITRTKEYFAQFLEGYKFICHPTIYKEPVVNVVTHQWISGKMKEFSIRIKDLQEETGIDKTNLSAMVNGKRPISQISKSMMYFYFLHLESKQKFDTERIKTNVEKINYPIGQVEKSETKGVSRFFVRPIPKEIVSDRKPTSIQQLVRNASVFKNIENKNKKVQAAFKQLNKVKTFKIEKVDPKKHLNPETIEDVKPL